jgi:hypothetical protein
LTVVVVVKVRPRPLERCETIDKRWFTCHCRFHHNQLDLIQLSRGHKRDIDLNGWVAGCKKELIDPVVDLTAFKFVSVRRYKTRRECHHPADQGVPLEHVL